MKAPQVVTQKTSSSRSRKALIGSAIAASIVVGSSLPYLMADEGFSDKPYYDVAGVLTDCFGETEGVRLKVHRDKATCKTILAKRVEEDYYRPLLTGIPAFGYLPAPTQTATVRLAYNIGVGATIKGSVGKLLSRGAIKEACDAFLLYNKARVKGKLTEVRGLTLRRQRERAQCMEGAS